METRSHAAATPPTVDIAQLRRLGNSPQPNRGSLWKIQHDGRSGYLYGTVHVGKVEWMFPGPEVKSAFEGSSVMAFEIDILDPTVPARIRKICKELDEKSPSDVPPEEKKELSDRLSEQLLLAGIAENTVDGGSSYKEIQLELNVATDLGLSPIFSVDVSLAAIGKAIGKEVVGLEPLEEQARAIYAPDSVVKRRLKEFEEGKSRKETVRLTHDWESGDLEDLEQIFFGGNDPDINSLVISRNRKLATAINALLQDQASEAFVSIGILHMVGKSSVIDELRNLGYTVSRIIFK